jgi:hypothetical protein
MSEQRNHRGKTGVPAALPAALCAALVLSVLWPAPASAHGASIVQTDSDFGPYRVVAVTSPVALSGDTLLTVVLSAAGDSPDPSPVTGAAVKASIETSGARQVVPVPAEPTRASSGYYETTVNIPGDGDANVSLEIDGTQGKVSVPFTIKRPAALTNWLTLGAESLVTAALICLLMFAAKKLRRPQSG